MISANHLLRASATLALGATVALIPVSGQRAASPVPTFQVDPFWPKPLPNHWILGSVTGVAVDAQDHIWLVHRGMDSLWPAPKPAGRNLYDRAARRRQSSIRSSEALLNSWGGRWDTTPRTPLGSRDAKEMSGSRAAETEEWQTPADKARARLKFSRDGKFLLQIGQPGKLKAASARPR
jgi:hypothetical protein